MQDHSAAKCSTTQDEQRLKNLMLTSNSHGNALDTPVMSSTVSTCGSITCTSATGSTADDTRSTPPGSPRLSPQSPTSSGGFSLEDLNDRNQVNPMADTAEWVTGVGLDGLDPPVTTLPFDAPPIPQSIIDSIFNAPPVETEPLSTWLERMAREFPEDFPNYRNTSGVGSPHHDETLPTETLQRGDDDSESSDPEIEYEEEFYDTDSEPDPLDVLTRMIEGRS